MTTYLKTMLALTVVVGLALPATASAKSIGGVTGGARLHPGTWNSQRTSRSVARVYRSTAPVIVRTEPAPAAVAQAPTEQQRFSYEPADEGDTGGGCHGKAATQPAPATAQQSVETHRRFSYEPFVDIHRGSGQRYQRSTSVRRWSSSPESHLRPGSRND
jgi:hypothetical protein